MLRSPRCRAFGETETFLGEWSLEAFEGHNLDARKVYFKDVARIPHVLASEHLLWLALAFHPNESPFNGTDRFPSKSQALPTGHQGPWSHS